MNLSQMISYWNYPNEQYDIVTKDGYILDLYRIPHGKGYSGGTDPGRPVVYLQHGLLATAFNWIANLPYNSLAYILADAGFDVWLGNSRGNTWSQRHVSLSPNSKEFWAFSFDEMAKYDLPATIDFIVKKTGQEQLYYVGHSQGTTIGFILFSINPKLAQRIKMFFGLGPVVSLKRSKNPPTKIYPFLEAVLKSRLDVFISNIPAGTSIQNIVHWGQIVTSGRLQAFDWKNPALNMKHYNQVTPPVYNVTLMRIPTALWSGGKDVMADPTDVDSLLPILSNLIYHKRIPYYTHMDLCIGVDSHLQIFYEILDMIKKNMQT
ncbi:lipase member K-like [Gracilinanus agilis]|uniref:lipase member K-like n=1 Tax=Gracilinanus agilis TaxID=191870 RepID=UPI001CFCFA4A|nr:lipase member K-like [Gracilinanus agilis]